VSSILARVINVGAILWMFQYILERVPTEEFAVYAVVTAAMFFAPVFFQFFTGGIARYIMDAYASNDRMRIRRIVSSVFPLLLASGVAFVVLGAVFASFIDDILTIPERFVTEAQLMLVLLVATFSMKMIMLPFGVGYQVCQRFVEMNILNVVREIIRVALMYFFLTQINAAVIWVVVATVAAELFHLAVLTVRSLSFVTDLRVDFRLAQRKTASELVSFGFWTSVGRLAHVIYSQAAVFILNGYGTALDVANYHVGATCFRQVQTFIALAREPLLPAMVAMNAREENERLANTTLRGGRYGLWASLFIATPTVIFAGEVVDLYLGEKFADAAGVLIFFMVILPFAQPTSLLPLLVMAKARVRPFTLGVLITVLGAVGLIFYFVAVLDYGAVGATLALTVATLVSQVAYFWPLQLRIAEARFSAFLTETLVRGVTPAIAAAVVGFAAKEFLIVDGWVELFAAAALCSLVYLITLVTLCLNRSDRQIVSAIAARFGGGAAVLQR